MNTLIIGGDSRLSLRIKKIYPVKYLTSRSIYKNNPMYLDLRDTSNFNIPEDVDKCIIVGGPVSYNQSNEDNNNVKNVHQVQIPLLAKNLLKKNIFTIYLSTNMVLGKNNLDRSEKSIPSPNIEYGKMKFICEQEIIKQAKELNKLERIAIFRMTKNISPETSPFNSWINAYKESKLIYAFQDLYFSPIYYEEAAKAIIQLIKFQKHGIFHFSGEIDLSYYDFCCEINKALLLENKKPLNIIASTSKERGVILEDIGYVTKLDMELTSSKLRLKPLSVKKICQYFIKYLID